ncbi:YceI family protein [Thiohalobacter sp. IOR34]|uniref:YceI family protein n=1 Tax=Thiohalobacter sp. IOR34 TaxID=3057176 RepID=UPI0025B0790E|nr:YceI family protein [Thiohalobacter sp. IOR34]WJW76438.1 YceI family protein [Thiohalobacter sp. IOR34]
MIRKTLYLLTLILGLASVQAQAAEHYIIDTKGMHAFITFRIQHLGFSWMEGRFNRFSGDFDYDEANPANNRVRVEIDVASIDTNHAERDKHLRSERFFDVKKYPKASFVSTGWEDLGEGRARLKGKFTLRGVTKDIVIDVSQVGAGKDPWGGFRRGFVGTTTLHLSDYKMKEGHILGPVAENIQLWLSIEGIRQ